MCSLLSSQIARYFEILRQESEKYTKSFMNPKFFKILITTSYHQKSQVIEFITSNNI